MALSQAYTGRTSYYTRHETPKGKLALAVAYQVGEDRVLSLLDTGAECGIFPAELAAALGYGDPTQGVPTILDTRYGRYAGHLVRIPTSIPADEGNGIDVDLTWLVIPDWPGPPVIGWGGCLERLRFALDPTPGEECFYFGPISE